MDTLDLFKRQSNNSTNNSGNNNNARNGDGAGLPQLWIFLLIVLAVLLTLVMSTSFVMHMLQRRQRTLLSRRIANGEVDLEMLGLKRLNVPQEQIDKMSQYVWSADPTLEEVKRPAPVAGSSHRHSTMFGQTVCPICLDDFVDGETQVRELPCNHIFHPECIDPFLLNNSSLCPVCKKSSLPPGFCPVEVTNVMVRRERLGRNMRRNQDRIQASRLRPQRHGVPTVVVTPSTSVDDNNTATNSVPPVNEMSNQDTELGVIQPQAPDAAEPPPEIASQGQAARRAWRRDRVASQHIREFEQHGEASREAEAKRPLWRRMFGLN